MSRQLENILSAEVIPQLTGDYTAGSASGKTVSIILNNYYSSVFCERGINANINDFSVFPPKNMFGHKYSRLGGKIFYTKIMLLMSMTMFLILSMSIYQPMRF